MKKICLLLLSLLLVIVLIACDDGNKNEPISDTSTDTESVSESVTDSSIETPTDTESSSEPTSESETETQPGDTPEIPDELTVAIKGEAVDFWRYAGQLLTMNGVAIDAEVGYRDAQNKTILPAVVDGSAMADTTLTLSGWALANAGQSKIIWSVDGSTWYECAAVTFAAASVEQIATATELCELNQPIADNGAFSNLIINLSAFAGETVDVQLAVLPFDANICHFTTIESITVGGAQAETSVMEGALGILGNISPDEGDSGKIDVDVSFDMTSTDSTTSFGANASLIATENNLALTFTVPNNGEIVMIFDPATDAIYLTVDGETGAITNLTAGMAVVMEELAALLEQYMGDMGVTGDMGNINPEELINEILTEYGLTMEEIMAMPGVTELLTTLSTMKPEDIFAEATVTVDEATGATTVVLAGLSQKVLDTLENTLTVVCNFAAATDPSMSPVMVEAMISSCMEFIKPFAATDAFYMTTVVDADNCLTAFDFVIDVDLSKALAYVGTEGSLTISAAFGIDVTYGNQTITVPAMPTDPKYLLTLEQVWAMIKENMVPPATDVFGVFGTVTAVDQTPGDASLTFTYFYIDETETPVEVECMITLTDEDAEVLSAHIGHEAYVEYGVDAIGNLYLTSFDCSNDTCNEEIPA